MESATGRPTVCLNMIVRNEAHIVHEVLDCVAPHINSWVIVDTGSTDGTQDAIRAHMQRLGIPGELHERPWRSFGHNRSEALDLAQGHGDYIWVIDADDLVVGAPNFSLLNADAYMLRYGRSSGFSYWRCQMFRDGLPWEYKGVVHEYVHCSDPHTQERLDGDYHIESRRLGDRSRDPQKYARDRDLLLADLDQNADNERSVFYLAQSYFDLGDYANARHWYAKRIEMGRWDQEVYYSMYRLAESMAQLGEPWATIQQEYLRAWEFRPTRAEPLCAIASHYRKTNRFQLGYKFAEWAATIEMPDDVLFVASDVYQWRVLDEVSICASWLGRHAESFAACRKLLAKPGLPEEQRPRIAGNRDFAVAAMVAAAEAFPREMVAGPRDLDVTVTLVAGSDRFALEKTLHSILNCCNDIDRSRRFLVVDCGLSAEDRESLKQNYGFLEFTRQGSTAEATWIRNMVTTRFWLHVTAGWTFFAPEPLIGRLIAVLEAEPDCTQVCVNVDDAVGLTGVSAPEAGVRRTADGSRYVIRNATVNGPAMFETTRLDRAGTSVACTATLDEVLVLQTQPERPTSGIIKDNMRDSVVRLRELGFDPKVILDVGAYEGRWARTATEVFPTARILSFEAQPGMEPALQETAAQCPNVEYTLGLLGDRSRHNVPFYVMVTSTGSTGSSMYEENTPFGRRLIHLECRTLNEILTERNMPKVDLIKLDTQGSELDILRGGEGIWNTAEAVIIEVSYVEYNVGGVAASDVVDYMAQWGYTVFDIADTHRGRGGILLQADLIFVPRDSAWRKKESWSW